MALIRLILSALADIIRESQRAAAVASGTLLITLTLMIAATSFPGVEPVLVGVFVGGLHLADALPFVEIASYFTPSDGGGNLSFSGTEEASGFLNDALLPFYAWLTAFLIALRWLLQVKPTEAGFWPRYSPVLIMAAICLTVFIVAAFTRDDVAGLAFLFLFLTVMTLATGAWAAFVAAVLDGWVSKLAPERSETETA